MPNDIAHVYHNWAPAYDREAKWNPAIRMEQGVIIPFLNPRKPDKILEVGCGTGRLTIPISRKCKAIVGLDSSERMLDIARKKSAGYKNIRYMQSDAEKRLPFDDTLFDKVVCPLVMNHIKDIQKFFNEVHRILASDGVMVFDDPNPDSKILHVAHKSLLDKYYDLGKRLFYLHSLDDYVHALHRSGFEIERIKFFRFDDRIRDAYTPETFRENEGHTFGSMFKASK